jgi:sphinganine-1-phosphate aldolase
VDQFLADLKDAVKEAKIAPSGKGTMVSLYGIFTDPLSTFDELNFPSL